MNTKIHQVSKVLLLFSAIFLSSLSVTKVNAQGPKAPEANSFEPVSAADMVNLLTGDFSYVLPLLEVPSPEGGYSIGLSYHAGIALEQEASWTGLGWNINPGAINRTVNGYADDWKYGEKVNLLFDKGGEYKKFTIGAGIGISEIASVGLYASFGEHRVFGGETTYSTDFGAEGNYAGVSGSIGTDGASLGYSPSSIGKANTEGFSVGLNYDSKTGKIAGSIEYSLGIAKIGYDTSNGYGTSSIINFNSGNYSNGDYSSVTSGFSGSIPIYGFYVNISNQKTRYWLFDKTKIESVGSLYLGDFETLEDNAIFRNKITQDSYESIYEADENTQYGNNNFSFLAYDSYSISSEGLGGKISPSLYQQGALKLLRQKTNIDESTTAYASSFYDDGFTKKINNESNNIYFYLEGNYSSYIRAVSDNWQTPLGSLSNITDLNVNNEALETSVNIDGIIESNYNEQKKQKTNGTYVEVFTNQEIIDNSSQIIEAKFFNRSEYLNSGKISDFENGIGAYKITNLDGRTYHYSLPVYQKEQFSRNTQKKNSFSLKFYEEQTLTPYATHWLLTAVTGPDYVDTNNNNILDIEDYGYWVEFEYGKWSDGFAWRDPLSGNFESEQSKSYSWGIKEIYYLDKVKTRTHTALFIKEDRKDNNSSIITIGQSRLDPEKYTDQIVKSYSLGSDGNYYLGGLYHKFSKYSFNAVSAETEHMYFTNISKHNTLKLKRIILIENEKVPPLLNNMNGQETPSNFVGELFIKERIYNVINSIGQNLGSDSFVAVDKTWSGEFYENILDVNDINLLTPNIENQALKVIDFDYDINYPLASGTFNSDAISKGRLTLNSVIFKGKKGVQMIPPYNFSYSQPNVIYNYSNMDDWGYYKNNPSLWSLNSIKNPTGGKINIEYESDDFYRTASNELRVFKHGLQFTFYEENNKLRYKIEKETDNLNLSDVNFNDYFIIGKTTNDIWVCYKHDYNQGGCKSRTGKIDIPKIEVDVVSVSSSDVIFETNLDYTSNSNGGLDWLYGRGPFGLDYTPSMIRVDKSRGECEEPPGCINVTDRLVFNYFVKANKINFDNIEGGLRVKKIATVDGNNNQYYKKYFYNETGFSENIYDPNYRSSGITSYKPSRSFQEIPYRSELPPPYVMYSNVTVKNYGSDNQSKSKSVYKFKTLEQTVNSENKFTMGDVLQIDISEDNSYSNVMVNNKNSTIQTLKYDIKNNLSSIGKLLSNEVYNSKDQLILKRTNNYKPHTEVQQGVSQETFKNYKGIWSKANSSILDYKLTLSSKINYPTAMESSTVVELGFNNITHFDKYDFNSGQLLETRTYSSNGKAFKTMVVPAYTVLAYNPVEPVGGYGMGSKVDDSTNKNMLIQQAARYTYLLDEVANTEKVIDANITTWNNDWDYRNHAGVISSPTDAKEKIWRKHKDFIWQGEIDPLDGTYVSYVESTDDDFNWGLGQDIFQTNLKWKNVSTATLYSHFSAPLETIDINGNYASTRMSDANSKILAVANAKYTEMYYSGAENMEDHGALFYEGGVVVIPATGIEIVSTMAHTGYNSVKLSANNIGGFMISANNDSNFRDGRYKISVWASKEGHEDLMINTGNGYFPLKGEVTHAGDWVQLNHYVTLNGNTTIIFKSGTTEDVYLDDFRLHPITSSMTSYVYNEWDELWCIIGTNGLATKFEYDAAGRLIKTYSEVEDHSGPNTGGFKPISKNRFNYKAQ